MAKGMYLTIGLNSVDPETYGGWDGVLRGCENDAQDMASIATSAGCTGVTLLTTQATTTKVIQELYAAALALESGDFFILSYSGHGGQIGDVTADENDDGLDETWCLFDRQFVDDELYLMWSHFKPGVRIIVFSDSCHSGTVVREFLLSQEKSALSQYLDTEEADSLPKSWGISILSVANIEEILPKAIPFDRGWILYIENKAFYDSLQYLAGPSSKDNISASVLLISGCQDNQLSGDGATNGLFTAALKLVWANGSFEGNYNKFRLAIGNLLPPSQSPNYFSVGEIKLEFEAQKPFTI